MSYFGFRVENDASKYSGTVSAEDLHDGIYLYVCMIGIALERTVRAWTAYARVELVLSEITPSIVDLPAALPRIWHEITLEFPEAKPDEALANGLVSGPSFAQLSADGRLVRVAEGDQIRHSGGVNVIIGLSELTGRAGSFTVTVRPTSLDPVYSDACRRLALEVTGSFNDREFRILRRKGDGQDAATSSHF